MVAVAEAPLLYTFTIKHRHTFITLVAYALADAHLPNLPPFWIPALGRLPFVIITVWDCRQQCHLRAFIPSLPPSNPDSHV